MYSQFMRKHYRPALANVRVLVTKFAHLEQRDSKEEDKRKFKFKKA